jgi:hypothetical protein
MVSQNERTKGAAVGFESGISGLSAATVLHLQVQGRFSGCLEVESEGRRALIFLRDGHIVHAEQGEAVGEDALFAVATWRGERVSLKPNVATTQASIQRGWDQLGPEMRGAVDRNPAGRKVVSAASAPKASSRQTAIAAAIERLSRIPGVAHAVVQTKEGARIGDETYEGEQLAGQTLYLSMVARQLGTVLCAGELQSAAVQGVSRHLLLFATRSHYLSVLALGESQVSAVESEVRKALSASK